MIARMPFRLGIVCATLGVVAWAALAAVITPKTAAEYIPPFAPDQLHLWAHELRQGAILLTVSGLALMMHRFRGVVLASTGVAIVLFIMDGVFDARDVSGVDASVSMAAGAGILLLVIFGLTTAQSEHDDFPLQRATLTAIAVMTAYCAPAVFANAVWPPNTATIPLVLFIATATIAAGLATVAGACAALAGYSSRERPYVVVAITVIPTMVAIAFVSVSEAGAFGLPSATIMGLVACRGMSIHKKRRRYKIAAIIIASFILAVPVTLFTLAPASVLGQHLITFAGYEMPVDGINFFPGAFLIGLGLGLIIARRKRSQITQLLVSLSPASEYHDAGSASPQAHPDDTAQVPAHTKDS